MPYKSIEISNASSNSVSSAKQVQFYKGYSSRANSTFKLFDLDLIKQNIINTFNTRKGERVMNPQFGSIVWDILMEPMTPLLRELLNDDIKSIILNEEIFAGIEFVFETHPRNSQYVLDPIFKDYETYDNNQASLGLIRNFNILSVKYKSTYGDLKVEISQVKPTITVDMIDFDSVGTDLEITLGATGLNPPFQWSFGYTASSSYNNMLFATPSFSNTNHYILPDTSGSDLVFDIKVVDSIGLTSSLGNYVINGGNVINFNGTFSYTTL
jgi:hypothetical protein